MFLVSLFWRWDVVSLTLLHIHSFFIATVFLHAHLQVVYYNCVKFHKNPISGLEGVALTRYMDRRMDGRTDRVIPKFINRFIFKGKI
jgi:hypothetical protein